MNASPAKERRLRTSKAAVYLGISQGTLRRLVKENKISGVTFGDGTRSPWLFDIKELDRYIEENQFDPKQPRKKPRK